jgi:alpha-tubulin suppressor-like RCC1 family protein
VAESIPLLLQVIRPPLKALTNIIDEGEMMSAGRNDFGELGLGDHDHRIEFVPVVNQPAEIKLLECGYRMTFVLTKDNKIYNCGYNGNGELGVGNILNDKYNILQKVNFPNLSETDEITRIVCGGYHTFIVVSMLF